MSEDPRDLWKRGATLDEVAKNPNGTWNLVRALSAISNINQDEVRAIWMRAVQLKKQGHSTENIRKTLRSEGHAKVPGEDV